MRNKKKHSGKTVFLLLLFIFFFTFFLQQCHLVNKAQSKPDFASNFYPLPIKGEQLIIHSQIKISYNPNHKQANWVAYKLDSAHTGDFKRKNNFYADPNILSNSVFPVEYKQSGYDRGHLAPAGDFTWSEKAMSESFYMSNISPQMPAFNRGIWKKLEEKARQWARENGEIYVVTAGVLTEDLPAIGTKNKITVPLYYYKVILDFKEPEIKAIGFVMENKAQNKELNYFAVTIDSVEALTGIDFFPAMDDKLENRIESSNEFEKWFD
ncbi:MAG: DNA/RNA non-specific endonuclease [Bacteroidetes bacterium]|nr:DNA/RNA non-specific endonuclease [Bacteroidota bacterium]HET6242945.1 DNA/RNA non-specific endonuclease [Bacteroidia bacterium]